MKKVDIYEPALCCETGTCGPNTDPELLRITALVRELQVLGVNVKRHNLNSDPMAFVTNTTVNQYLNDNGAEGLPCTVVDDQIVIKKRYPTRSELFQYAGLEV